jgi:cytochrome c biogenesis factor
MTVREKIEKGFELANYLVLTLLITAQCTVGSNFFVGQFIYFSANVLAVVRCFVLKRPMADKVKDFCMLGITTGLILIKFLGGIRS